MSQTTEAARINMAMAAINGDIAQGILPLEIASYHILREVREAVNEPVTTPHDALPGIVRAKHRALAMIHSVTTDPRVLELARAGLYGHEPGEAA